MKDATGLTSVAWLDTILSRSPSHHHSIDEVLETGYN